MTDKFKGNEKQDKIQIDINTEYIGNEETAYIYTVKTEYEELNKNKTSKANIINQRYEIVGILGQGGMGVVYKALDIRLRNIPVAIKEISLETIKSENIEKVIENFENEAKILVQLRHNSIPRVMDFFSLDNDKCYIVMDLIEGETLDQVVKRRGKIPENEVRQWLTQLADVLSYLHSREPKVIFRDLKPSNVMLTKDNEIKLIDFGIARTFKDGKDSDTEYYVSKGFSSPEQYGTGQSDERSDIYSLGALLYSLLIGGKPKIKDFKFESLKNYIDISDELDNAIMLATEFRPENRPQSIDEFIKIVTEQKHLNESICNNNSQTKSNNFKKISTLIVSISVLLFGMYTFSHRKEANKDENVYGSKSNIINKVDSNIEKATNILYETTSADKDSILYEINTKGSYVTEQNIKDNYYIFDESDIENGDMSERNFLVNKTNFKVYVCYPGGTIIPYEDFINKNTVLGSYFNQYLGLTEDEIPNNTKEYFDKNGMEAFHKEILNVLKDAREYTIKYFGGPVLYVDQVLSGKSANELDIQAYAYPDHEFAAITIIDRMMNDYEVAVETGNPSIMYPYVTGDGDSRKSFDKNIPIYYEKGITVELVDYTINDIKIESENELRIPCVTEYNISNKNGTRLQKEKLDYIVMLTENKEAFVDRIENWSVIEE